MDQLEFHGKDASNSFSTFSTPKYCNRRYYMQLEYCQKDGNAPINPGIAALSLVQIGERYSYRTLPRT